MRTLNLICQAVCQLVRQVWQLPRTVANAFKQREARAVSDKLEVERLDRIRNPSKYLGK